MQYKLRICHKVPPPHTHTHPVILDNQIFVSVKCSWHTTHPGLSIVYDNDATSSQYNQFCTPTANVNISCFYFDNGTHSYRQCSDHVATL